MTNNYILIAESLILGAILSLAKANLWFSQGFLFAAIATCAVAIAVNERGKP